MWKMWYVDNVMKRENKILNRYKKKKLKMQELFIIWFGL